MFNQKSSEATGSGVIWDKEGHIVTNLVKRVSSFISSKLMQPSTLAILAEPW
jgi:hypothetical protein